MLFSRILQLAANIGVLIAIGSMGFCILENWNLADSVYMTVITISTVGYGEMGDLSPTGRLFTSILIITSIVCMACWTARVTSVFVEGDLTGRFRERRMEKMAGRLNNHIIICGAGVFARAAIDVLYGNGHPIVVVCEENKPMQNLCQVYPDLVVITSSPSEELSIAKAGLSKAAYVVAATDSDIDNLLISMTCRQLNTHVRVYALSTDPKIGSRMNKLGVSEVICPEILGGNRVADLIAKNEKRKLPAPLLAESLPYIGSA